jgi:putative ABC transport system permease protein
MSTLDGVKSSNGGMEHLLKDLRFGIRNLLRVPGFTVPAVLALALGIGATTAIFSVVDGVVLRPLPYADPERLVMVWETNREKSLEHEPLSPVNFMDYRALTQVFTDAAAWWRPDMTLRDERQEPVRVTTIEVSGNFQSVMGVSPVLGPGFPAEGPFYSPDRRVVLVSHRLWRTRFSSDPAIVGRQIRMNETQYEVVGIMPPGFNFPGDTDLWCRLSWDLTQHSRAAHFMEAVGRLSPGRTVADAQREIDALTARLANEFGRTNRGWGARVVELHREVVGFFRPALFVLLGAVGLLLVIACINVASLLLARAVSRSREVAVRAAIGASRRRLIAQFLTESLLLAAASAIVGVALAAGGIRALMALTPIEVPRLQSISIDARVLAFAVGLAVVTAVLFGLLPALLTSRANVQQALKEGGRSPGSGRAAGRMHRVLVVAEVALAVMLLVGAALLVQSVRRLTAEDPGFRPPGAITMNLQVTGPAYAQWVDVARFHAAIVESLKDQPGVAAAGSANFLPLAAGWRIPFLVRGAERPNPGEEPTAQYHSVSEGYFASLGATIVRGRDFTPQDTADSRGVALINETLARKYFGGEDPVGRTILSLTRQIGPLGRSLMEQREHEIVGVVRDVKNTALQSATEPAIYHSQRQFPFRSMFLVVRGGDPGRLVDAVKDAVRRTDPGVPLATIRSLEEVVGAAADQPRFLMFLLGAFAVFALGLAALGIYGVLSYAVAERRQEISIRMALGAQPSGVLWLMLRQGLLLTIGGSAAGVLGAWLAARALAAVLFGVAPGDPAALVGATFLALVVALFACILPAWRASRLDPLAALRSDV